MTEAGASRRVVLAGGLASLGGLLATGLSAAKPPAALANGFNIGPFNITRHDLAFFAAVATTGARTARMFLEFRWDADVGQYVLPQGNLAALQRVLNLADSVGLKVLLVGDFETAPNPALWGHAGRAAAFVQAWQSLAARFKGHAALSGYDLLNEPNPPWVDGSESAARQTWRALAASAIQAIRAQDPTMPVVFEGVGGGQAIGLRGLVPFDAEQVIYSFHFYSPHAITHQNVSARWPQRIAYPVHDARALDGTDAHPGPWDLHGLRAAMQDAIDFQRLHKLPVFVGEFSCVRWAPGESALNYVRDCLSLFDQYGFAWCYHEFRGWPGWDAEVASTDPLVTQRSQAAPIMRLLRQKMPHTTALALYGTDPAFA